MATTETVIKSRFWSIIDQNLLLITAVDAGPGLAAQIRRLHGVSERIHRAIAYDIDMTDILIRDVPEDVVRALDHEAARQGLSRAEYIRRKLAQTAPRTAVTRDDFKRFSEICADLADEEIMRQAWS